jgi:hypothetical protein
MFGLLKPKLPITEEQRLWIDKAFARLAKLLGSKRLFDATVMLPTREHFPDSYDRSEQALQAMFQRVAKQMKVNAREIELTIFASAYARTREITPFFTGGNSGAAGLYQHNPEEKAQISVREDELEDPMSLVASLAHELGHVILLRPGLVKREELDMEKLNDLLTVFLGFGVFTANCAFRFEQHQSNNSQGWSASRKGYLSEEQYGYALARFAYERREEKPAWASFLTTNILAYYKRSAAWLTSRKEQRLMW